MGIRHTLFRTLPIHAAERTHGQAQPIPFFFSSKNPGFSWNWKIGKRRGCVSDGLPHSPNLFFHSGKSWDIAGIGNRKKRRLL